MQTSKARNGEIVNLKLSIEQCKLIERLVDAELFQSDSGTSEFDENALKHILDVFMTFTRETDAERDERFENWAAPIRAKWVGVGYE